MRKILIVEDDVTLRETFSDIISFEGYGVHSVSNGKEALEYLGSHAVDLILSDVRMPIMGGVELLSELKKRQSYPTFVLISGYAEDFTVEMAKEKGAVDLLNKPIDIDQFLQKIKVYAQ